MSSINAALRLALGHAPLVPPRRIFIGGLLALMAYCLGHGVFSGEPVDFALSSRWSLAHATGVGLIAVVAFHTHRRPWLVRFIAALVIGLAGSVLVAGTGLHGYASITWYLLVATAAPALLVPAVERAWVELDFGRSRRIVPAREIIAVHGARNYAEVEIEGASRPGIIRTTLESVLQQHPARLVRVHRSHLVDPRRIVEVRAAPRGALVVRLCNGSEVPVSPRYAAGIWTLLASVPAAADSSHSASGET
jgi:hypothetical protein